ncbi:MAG: 3-deoxy-manno-octulosonate cytidylyltransferase [Planctomycetota bacterium]|nr:3-deoxy-manno-octulosonate cytidylyltransferase [Planctomycetota bacterium]
MSTVVIIPARYASKRLPGKALLAETGKPLIQHVVESIRGARQVSRTVVATDDERIAEAVGAFGGEVIMTGRDCRSGTDRLAEAAERLDLGDEQVVLNVQGDEPDLPPEHLDKLTELLKASDAPMATLAAPLPADCADDPNHVKVVCDSEGKAMYFSRAKIPYNRDAEEAKYLWHLGVYAYQVGFLRWYAALPSSPAEQAEKLEQLRVLENGRSIAVAVVTYAGRGIDTPEDYAAFVQRNKLKGNQDG